MKPIRGAVLSSTQSLAQTCPATVGKAVQGLRHGGSRVILNSPRFLLGLASLSFRLSPDGIWPFAVLSAATRASKAASDSLLSPSARLQYSKCSKRPMRGLSCRVADKGLQQYACS